MSLSVFLTVYFWLFLGLMLGVAVWAIARTVVLSRGRYRVFSRIEDWLETLLRQGCDGGCLRLIHEQSGRFLHFQKYIRGKDDYGLEFRASSSDGLDSAWEKAQSIAVDHGLACHLGPSDLEYGGNKFLIIECGRDTAAAFQFAKSIWTEVFGLSLWTPYKSSMEGTSMFDELIDGPDHSPPLDDLSSEEWLKEFDSRQRKLGKPSSTAGLFGGIMVYLFMISGIGFPIAMLLSRGLAPDWSVELGVLSLGGSAASLVFLVILVASFCAMLRLLREKGERRKKRWDRRLRWLGRTILAGFPIAVLLAWTGF